MSKAKLSFEQSLKRLDEIVHMLEKGDAPLKDSLTMFEEGTSLVSACDAMLAEAEQKVVKLKKGPEGTPVELPFEDAERYEL